MRKNFTEAQIAFALKQGEHGVPVAEVIRKMGITEQTHFRWKNKYWGLGLSELGHQKESSSALDKTHPRLTCLQAAFCIRIRYTYL